MADFEVRVWVREFRLSVTVFWPDYISLKLFDRPRQICRRRLGIILYFISEFSSRWLQSLTMEVILSTAFGVKAETQTVEKDPFTELAKKAMEIYPLTAIFCKNLLL